MHIDVNRSSPTPLRSEAHEPTPLVTDSNWFNTALESPSSQKNRIPREINPDAFTLAPLTNRLSSSSRNAGANLEKLSKSSNPMDILISTRSASELSLEVSALTKVVGKTFQACEKLTNLA